MLRWEKDINGYNGNWMGGYIGFDDGEVYYYVTEDYEDGGWFYIFYRGKDDLDGTADKATYVTAEAAMEAAAEHYKTHNFEPDLKDLEPYTLEEIDEILGDRLYDERKEEGLF